MLSITKFGLRGRSADGQVGLKVFGRVVETVKLEQALRRRGLRREFVFQRPGVGMMHVDGVQAGRRSRD